MSLSVGELRIIPPAEPKNNEPRANHNCAISRYNVHFFIDKCSLVENGILAFDLGAYYVPTHAQSSDECLGESSANQVHKSSRMTLAFVGESVLGMHL